MLVPTKKADRVVSESHWPPSNPYRPRCFRRLTGKRGPNKLRRIVTLKVWAGAT